MPDAEEPSLWHVPLSETIVRQMYTLACTPFELSAFQQKWQQFGWSYTPASDDEFGFRVEVEQELHLIVAPNDSRVDCVILPFCYWEEYEEEWHGMSDSFQQERHVFNSVYENAYARIKQVLGVPYSAGHDDDAQAHRHAIWRGDTAWLILQQAAFDIEFGLEVDIWLEPDTEAEFAPTTPLIDWLISRRASPE